MAKKESKEVVTEMGKLNELITIESKRPNGSTRIQLDYSNCPTLAEQHSALETDLNYIIKKHTPDEIQAYINQKNANRPEIVGHDFSLEPDRQEAMTAHYHLKKAYSELPEEITSSFKSHVEFLKFIDNPANAEKMIKLGLMTPKQVQQNQTITPSDAGAQPIVPQ